MSGSASGSGPERTGRGRGRPQTPSHESTRVLPSWIFDKVEEVRARPLTAADAGAQPAPHGGTLGDPLSGRGAGRGASVTTLPRAAAGAPGGEPGQAAGQAAAMQPGLSEWLHQQAQLSWQRKEQQEAPAAMAGGGQAAGEESAWAAAQRQQQAAASQQVIHTLLLQQLHIAELLERRQREMAAARLPPLSGSGHAAQVGSPQAALLALQLIQQQQQQQQQLVANQARARQLLGGTNNSLGGLLLSQPPLGGGQPPPGAGHFLPREAPAAWQSHHQRDSWSSPFLGPPEPSPVPSPQVSSVTSSFQERSEAVWGAAPARGMPVPKEGRRWQPPPLASVLETQGQQQGSAPWQPASMQSPATVLSRGLMRVGLGSEPVQGNPWLPQPRQDIERTSSVETSAQSSGDFHRSERPASPLGSALRHASGTAMQEPSSDSFPRAEDRPMPAGSSSPQATSGVARLAALQEEGNLTGILKQFLASDLADRIDPAALPGLVAASLKAQALARTGSQSSTVPTPQGAPSSSPRAPEEGAPFLIADGADQRLCAGPQQWLSPPDAEQQEARVAGHLAGGSAAAGMSRGGVSTSAPVPPGSLALAGGVPSEQASRAGGGPAQAASVLGDGEEAIPPLILNESEGSLTRDDPMARTTSFSIADFLSEPPGSGAADELLTPPSFPPPGTALERGPGDGAAIPSRPGPMSALPEKDGSAVNPARPAVPGYRSQGAPAAGSPMQWEVGGREGGALAGGAGGGAGAESDPYAPLDHLLSEPYCNFEGDLLLGRGGSALYSAYDSDGLLGPSPLDRKFSLLRGQSFADSWGANLLEDLRPEGGSGGCGEGKETPSQALLSLSGITTTSSLDSLAVPPAGDEDGAALPAGSAPPAGSGTLAPVAGMQFRSEVAAKEPGTAPPAPKAVAPARLPDRSPQGGGDVFSPPFRDMSALPPADRAIYPSKGPSGGRGKGKQLELLQGGITPCPSGGAVAAGRAWTATHAAQVGGGAASLPGQQQWQQQQQQQPRPGSPPSSLTSAWRGAQPPADTWQRAKSPLKRERSKSVAEWDKGLAKRQVGSDDGARGPGEPGPFHDAGRAPPGEALAGREGGSSVTGPQRVEGPLPEGGALDLAGPADRRMLPPAGGAQQEHVWGSPAASAGGGKSGLKLYDLLRHVEAVLVRLANAEGRNGAGRSAPPSPRALAAQVRREKIGERLQVIREQADVAGLEVQAAMRSEAASYLRALEGDLGSL